MKTTTFFVVLALCAVASADMYMHNMRGSNNRLNENNQNRNNANRLFDSQNNNRGGYNVGDDQNKNDGQGQMDYYASSVLSIEWTNQHGAENPNVNTEVVIQYMCDNQAAPFNTAGLRDGANTNRVNNDNANNGRHETADFYAACENRERNKGLFLADQNLNGDTAKYTRQNTNGDRNGYECPEEKEYYPYWHPTSWKDVAVLTSEPSRCALYKAQSQNVLAKNYCTNTQYNNQATCEANGGTWATAAPFAVPAPDCKEIGFSRDNHLGNSVGGQPLMYNWTLPNDVAGACALRVRYNISTNDYDGWDPAVNASLNGKNSPIQDNPTVNFADATQAVVVKLALNTDQYGRTFQDRSHKFEVSARPAVPANADIYNLNVRGRRGNIVQTYPSVEYDFAPSMMTIPAKDYVHLQWTGSQNTPDGAGQGAGSTDKSNLIEIDASANNQPKQIAASTLFAKAGANAAQNAATVGKGADVNNELNNAPSYFNSAPFQANAGEYHYMSTRNNNFTNRSQKGVLNVV